MEVLVVGGGGREHALAWKAAQSDRVTRVYVAPGNAGTAQEVGIENINIHDQDIAALKAFAAEQAIGLTLVGPEAPLAAGIVDEFRAAGLKIFGPDRQAAQLESSKVYAKQFMDRYAIPNAQYQSFTDYDQALAYIEQQAVPIVIKADGLAAGKGVIVAKNKAQAIDAVKQMLLDDRFGKAGKKIIIEEYLTGEEVSFICMVDGYHVLPMASSQDHKARDEGDQGPNTGGMGAYSPAPIVDQALHEQIMKKIIWPTIRGMQDDQCPYCGFLYAGMMIDQTGTAKVLEYNCRFGDPEAQPLMMRLQSDLVTHCLAAIDQDLDKQTAHWEQRVALGVVMACKGYPGTYAKGMPIQGLPKMTHDLVKVFHGGTAQSEQQIITDGGRVLCVVGLADDLAKAQQLAYRHVGKINWDQVYYRRDIGHRAIQSPKPL